MEQRFDLLTCPLDGVQILEASAGTGKTYSLVGLVVRLVVERGVPLEQILVVTFTEAATQELRERVARRLEEALEALENDLSRDELLATALQHCSRDQAGQRLQKAISGIGDAPIFTIHGFCNFVIREFPLFFATGRRPRLMDDVTPLRYQYGMDLLRRSLYNEGEDGGVVLQYKKNPWDILKIEQAILSRKPEMIKPEQEHAASRDVLKHLRDSLAKIQGYGASSLWRDVSAFFDGNVFDRNKLKFLAKVKPILEDFGRISQWFSIDAKAREKLKVEPWASGYGLKKGKTVPPVLEGMALLDEFAQVSEELENELRRTELAIVRALITEGEPYLMGLRSEQGALSYDDMLNRVHQALQSDVGGEVAAELRKTFSHVLVDEFQDTDKTQYEILHRVFPNLKFIGDPKQAIYSFRGGDIFTYRQALRDNPEGKLVLDRTFRFDPQYLKGVNVLFGQHSAPFVFSEFIEYSTIRSGREGDTASAVPWGTSPLQFVWLPETDPETGKTPIKQPLLEWAANHTANTIVHALQEGNANPGDFAVLVRKHDQGRLVAATLRRSGVPVVLDQEEHLLESEGWQELRQVLWAMYRYRDVALVRTAMLSAWMGFVAEDVLDESPMLTRVQAILGAARSHWYRSGAILGIEELRRGLEGLPKRILPSHEYLLGFDHCLEVISSIERQGVIDPDRLLHLLSQRDAIEELVSSDILRRRGSAGDGGVVVMTIHRSKGLEFPYVVVPFAWQGRSRSSNGPFLYHDPSQNYAEVLELRDDDPEGTRWIAENEALAEETRLFYVAVTRAKRGCVVIDADYNSAPRSALWYLLRGDVIEGQECDIQETLMAYWKGRPVEEKLRAFDELEQASDGAIGFLRLGDPPEAPSPFVSGENTGGTVLTDPGFLVYPKHKYRGSFTSIRNTGTVSHGEPGSLLPSPSFRPEGQTILDFPAGAAPGTFLHTILEDACKANTFSLTLKDAERRLEENGYDPAFAPALVRLVHDCGEITLDAAQPASTLANARLLPEMEFTLSYRGDLFGVTEMGGENDWRSTLEVPAHGLIRGYIDLVAEFGGRYYILDWKSNHLGVELANYDRDAMHHAMIASGYDLQYSLYAKALHRLLQGRCPGYAYQRHFGGVLYIFLRGIGHGEAALGVYRVRPERSHLEPKTTA